MQASIIQFTVPAKALAFATIKKITAVHVSLFKHTILQTSWSIKAKVEQVRCWAVRHALHHGLQHYKLKCLL